MLRLLKVRIPKAERDEVLQSVEELEFVETHLEDADGEVVGELLVESDLTESVVEVLESDYGETEGFRIISLSVEATVPQPKSPDEQNGKEESTEESEQESPPINIEELYNDVTEGMEINWSYAASAVLSAVVAAVGILRNDVAVVIAAMIIAPLLKPNMALSLATTLADGELAWKSVKVNVVGMLLSVAVATLFGALYPVDPAIEQIELRTKVGFLEMGLAVAAGAAGAMSFTSSEASKVVGVMVAVALLPPVVVFGMLLGASHWQLAIGAAFLTSANVVCLNLAGVVTFLIRRIHPRRAFESDRASRATRTAIAIWLVLLAALAVIVYFGGPFRRYP